MIYTAGKTITLTLFQTEIEDATAFVIVFITQVKTVVIITRYTCGVIASCNWGT